MNTRTLFIAATFCLSTFALQTASAQRLFDLGPKAGISYDDLSLSRSHIAVLGWQAGVFARLKPPLFPGVQGELLVTSMGSDITASNGGGTRVRSVALQVPVFAVFSIGPAEIHLGGYADKLLNTTANSYTDADGTVHERGELTNGGYGLLLGGGLHLGSFYAGVRYNYGLNDISTGEGFLESAQNRQAQLYVAIGLFK
jgi:hypothetical protein